MRRSVWSMAGKRQRLQQHTVCRAVDGTFCRLAAPNVALADTEFNNRFRDHRLLCHQRFQMYGEANLAVRRRKKNRRAASERMPLQIAQNVNEVWSMDFVCDSLANARRIRCLTVADDFSQQLQITSANDCRASGQRCQYREVPRDTRPIPSGAAG